MAHHTFEDLPIINIQLYMTAKKDEEQKVERNKGPRKSKEKEQAKTQNGPAQKKKNGLYACAKIKIL